MRNLLGVAFTVVGVWFVYTSVTLRVRRLVERRAAGIHDHEAPATRMFVFGEIMRPIILFFLAVLAIKAVFAYFWLDAARYFSLFDLGGLMGSRGIRLLGLREDQGPPARALSTGIRRSGTSVQGSCRKRFHHRLRRS